MALHRAELEHAEASDQWFLDHFASKGSVARGDYENCIRNWRSVFPSDQLLIETYDRLIDDPIGLANRCLEHIGANPLFRPSDESSLSQPVFAGDGARVRPTLSQTLSGLYNHKIRALQEYLGIDLSRWMETP